jgi:beta-lactamase regulating signal transducer with metallopeptidase domain
MIETLGSLAVAIGRSPELSVAVLATLAVSFGLLLVRVSRHSRASVRHILLTATFAGLLALPAARALAPQAVAIEVPVVQSQPVPTEAGRTTASPSAAIVGREIAQRGTAEAIPAFTRQTILRLAWATGVLALACSLGGALWHVARLRRSALPWIEGRERVRTLAADAGVRGPIEVLLHEGVAAPLVSGIVRPAILLPSDAPGWSDAELRRALVHEVEHVRRGDWGVQMAARAACAFYWFHPLVWVAHRRLCLEAERACDDAVVAVADRTDYAEQLVRLATRLSRTTAQPALGMAKRSDLSARVSAILDASQHRGRAGMTTAAAALVTMAGVVIALAPVRAVPASPTHEASALGQTVPRVAAQEAGGITGGVRGGVPGGVTGGVPGGVRRLPSALDRALYEAAEEGDVDAIAKLLDAGADVNAAIGGDGSPLIGAARQGRLDAVRLLLDRGADPNGAVRGDGNPLIMAAREGHVDVVELLLEREASIDEIVPGDENALIQASGHGQLAVVKLLVSRGADVNARAWAARSADGEEGEWRTPLGMARRGKHEAIVAFLQSAGARDQ